MYALRMQSGTLIPETFAMTKSDCWAKAFSWVALCEGRKWHERYWKKWDASLRSARRLGYRIVKVKLVEA